MSSTSALDNEDIENVPAIRLEDVQPRRHTVELLNAETNSSIDDCETECILDSGYHEEFVINNDDDDSNIGSMVSIHSEEVIWDDSELIIPEIVNQNTECKEDEQSQEKTVSTTNAPDSWPTLEILPGGIIKNADKLEDTMYLDEDLMIPKSEMIYACAKCPQKFKYLFCLVQHVKLHEIAKKKPKSVSIVVPKQSSPKPITNQKSKCIAFIKVKQRTRKVPKKSIAYV